MSSVDPTHFVETLSPAMRQAASIARALEGRVQNTPKSEESTAVKQALTVADTATQEAILVPLLEHFPSVALEAEEDTETAARFAASGPIRVVCDPIDGTLHSYLRGEGPYAVMVGLECAGRYDAALVALPREGLFFDAVRGAGAYVTRAGSQRRVARVHEPGNRVLVSHGMPEPVFAALRDHGWDPVPACGGAVAVAPLVKGVRAGLRWGTAEQGVSIRGRIGLLIAREAGMLVRGARGEPFPEDVSSPAPALLVASSEEDLAVLDAALAMRVSE
jgi:fructose-1,6-bisphosphatase/inositol monophosphatase family enzyme